MCDRLLLISRGHSERIKFLALRIHVFVLANCESKPKAPTMIVSQKKTQPNLSFALKVCEDARCCACLRFWDCNSSIQLLAVEVTLSWLRSSVWSWLHYNWKNDWLKHVPCHIQLGGLVMTPSNILKFSYLQ